MKQEMNIRDQFAISMPTDLIPLMNTAEAVEEALRKMGLEDEINLDTVDGMMRFQAAWCATCAYVYADEMMRVREL